MTPKPSHEIYTLGEVARAAEVSEQQVAAALGRQHGYVSHAEAIRVGRSLVRPIPPKLGLFAVLDERSTTTGRQPLHLAISGAVHGALFAAAVIVTTFGTVPASVLEATNEPGAAIPLVFIALPGPGGGGGGGGTRQRVPAPRALREGTRSVGSPLPARELPVAQVVPDPVEPPLQSEPLPPIAAPVVPAPADPVSRAGVLEEVTADVESRGPGQDGGTGSGVGTGIGAGSGSGIGDGSGGGTGGGPFRPGSGIEPPRLLREVKPDFTDDARRRGITGDVLLEIVVRRDGSVGDVRILRALGAGLDERAVTAVRAWRFTPARRRGIPVDVVVEVAVEFALR